MFGIRKQRQSDPFKEIELLESTADVDRLVTIMLTEGPASPRAAEALGRLRVPKAFEPLCEVVAGESRTFNLVFAAIDSLRKFRDPRATDALSLAFRRRQCLKSPADGLAEIGTPEAIGVLIDALDHSEREIRADAARALLSTNWQPPDDRLRILLAVGSGHYKAAALVGPLAFEPLFREDCHDADSAICLMGAAAIPMLRDRIQDPHLRSRVVRILGGIHHDSAG